MSRENIIRLSGRIDSSNARETENLVFKSIQASPDAEPVFDASGLEYISSAGLRILMKVTKSSGHAPEIREVSPEVYEILEMTGFTEIMTVKKRMREVSVDGCEIIGRGFYGTVYRLDPDTIVKVYSSPDSLSMIENERRMAKLAFVKGIPTAISYDIVKVGDSYGSVFELLKAKTLNDLLIAEPDKADSIIAEFIEVLKSVHAADIEPETLPSAKDIWLGFLDDDLWRGYLTDELYGRLKKLLEDIPECGGAVHGDFHMKNVMQVDGEPMLIDMDTLSSGNPVFDLQGIYMTYQEFGEDDPDNSMSFLGISNEMSGYVWRKSLEYYFGTDDEAVLSKMSDKIRLTAAVRFLSYLDTADADGDSLDAVRLRHTQQNIAELIKRVDSLGIGG